MIRPRLAGGHAVRALRLLALGEDVAGVESLRARRHVGVDHVRVRLERENAVQIFKCVEGSRSSMMDVEDEHNHMGTAFGLPDRFGQPATPARE
jgi:hypothetical protein